MTSDCSSALPNDSAAGVRETMPLRLNIGCGPIQPEGWVNIDCSNRAKLASWLPWLDWMLVTIKVLPPTEFNSRTRIADIRKRLIYADNTVDVIYSGETLEHLTHEQGGRFLAECFRVLRPGGVLRIRVPDNYLFWKQYVSEYEQNQSRPREQWDDRHTRWVQMFFRDICVRRCGLHSMGHYHKWMYDEISLTLALERAGFAGVQRRSLRDSRIPDVALVEVHEYLIVEAIKPTK
jgi:predicted SAM-dependent methyltransferase